MTTRLTAPTGVTLETTVEERDEILAIVKWVTSTQNNEPNALYDTGKRLHFFRLMVMLLRDFDRLPRDIDTLLAENARLDRTGEEIASKLRQTESAYDLLREERDWYKARLAATETALTAVEPYIDAIVCYASTISEHDGNRVAALVRAALPTSPATEN